jgi:O-antigen/teichoic acid export membrane protein
VFETVRGPNVLKTGAALSYVVIALQFVVSLIYTPIMLRLLGQAQYGLYSLVASIVVYLSLVSYGFSAAYIRFFAGLRVLEDWDGVRRLNGMFLLLFTTMGLIATLGGTFLALNVQATLGGHFAEDELDTARILFAILVVNLAITFPSSLFNSYVIAHERFVFLKVLQIVGAVVTPLITLPILLLGFRSIGMAIVTTVINIAMVARTFLYCRLKLKMRFAFRGLSVSLIREVTVFSSFIFINLVVDEVNWNAGKFVISRFHGALPVAVYAVAAMFNLIYMSFSTAISAVSVPRVNMMVASSECDDGVSDLFIRVGRLQLCVLGLVVSGFVFFGRPFIELWAGKNYGDAYVIALLLMVPVTIPSIQNLGIEIQKAKNLHHFRTWVYLAVAVGNVLISIPLTERFGGVGAAAATAVAVVIGSGIFMNWHYQARVGLDIKRFWGQMLRVSRGMVPAVVAGTVIVCTADLRNTSMLLLLGGLYILVYAVGVWWLGMNDYERRLFGSPLRGLARRLRG